MRRSRRTSTAVLAAVLSAAVICSAGCTRAIGGTPTAPPGQAGLAARVNTTCGDFVKMSRPERLDVIVAIGEDGNKILAGNPDQWTAVAATLCQFVDPNAPVKDILPGGMR